MNYHPYRGQRVCLQCGKKFEAHHNRQELCGPECKKSRKKELQSGYDKQKWRINQQLKKRIALLKKENDELRERLILCGAEV